MQTVTTILLFDWLQGSLPYRSYVAESSIISSNLLPLMGFTILFVLIIIIYHLKMHFTLNCLLLLQKEGC